MNRSLKLHAFTCLAIGVNVITTFAAETLVYEFTDGTVMVTPRTSNRTSSGVTQIQTNLSADQNSSPIEINPAQRRLKVQPASLQQASQVIPPAPMPPEVFPHLNAPGQPASNSMPIPQQPPTLIDPHAASPAGCCDLPIITPRYNDVLPRTTTTVSTAALYRDVYNSIPFLRTEYNYYPNYRHDATMEFLFNQMRTTTINRNTGFVGYDYYGPGYGYLGYPYYDPPAYPFSYGLRIHRSR